MLRGDIWKRTDQATGMNIGRGQDAGKGPTTGIGGPPYGQN